MAAEGNTQTEPTTTDPQTEPKQGEAAQGGGEGDPKPAAEGQGGGEGEVEDKHGHPGINREKYQRDMAAKDKEIAELKAQVAEAAKTEEGRKALEERIAKLEADQKDERITHKLEMAGCLNAKAAKALLDDYEGDVAKLREACPYLFSDGKAKQTGSTGLKPDGDAEKALDEKLDRAFGLKKKE
ncbi:hypothetical protein [Olsenella sp. An188]|uniref:hypothetical protein n=1 Tax=Olsenella sp. An188 TaxID=1965579 RepID=UPI000B3ACDF5|nr:hypothetical protein [Olsenella sp. An188]OUP37958.1 hypothetical protein B5F23_08355 [Olsenella sp. An188]